MVATVRRFPDGIDHFMLFDPSLAHIGSSVVGVLVDEVEVVADADEWPAVAGDGDDGAVAEDRVDRAPLEAELGKVTARE
jgi:hypothetical protein